MKKYGLIILFISFLTNESAGQNNRYFELLEIAKEQAGLVLQSKPSRINFAWRMVRHTQEQRIKSLISDTLINELISATKSMDSTKWLTNEFTRTVVVDDRKDIINTREILNKWKIEDKEERKKYKKLLNKWINTEEWNRPVSSLSRPVVTKNEEFGLILTNLTSGGLCCGGEVKLYRYESDHWKELGTIYKWNY